MKSRRINTPCDFNPKHSSKKLSKSILAELLTLPNNPTESAHSRKVPNPLQPTTLSNCLQENRGEAQGERKKSPLPKKVLISMHRTAIKWGFHEYGKRNDKKSRGRMNLNCSKQRRKCNITSELPELSFKENAKFNPNPTSEKRDEYIRYIISNKKALLDKKNDSKSKCRRAMNQKPKGDFSVDLARRDSILSNDSSEIRSFNMGGISFEVHSKGDGSSMNSLEYLEPNISKEMSLMFYDFNGARSRVNSNSPRPEKASQSNGSKTAEHFFQHKAEGKLADAKKPEARCESNLLAQCEVDGKRSKSPPIFTPLTNNSIFY